MNGIKKWKSSIAIIDVTAYPALGCGSVNARDCAFKRLMLYCISRETQGGFGLYEIE